MLRKPVDLSRTSIPLCPFKSCSSDKQSGKLSFFTVPCFYATFPTWSNLESLINQMQCNFYKKIALDRVMESQVFFPWHEFYECNYVIQFRNSEWRKFVFWMDCKHHQMSMSKPWKINVVVFHVLGHLVTWFLHQLICVCLNLLCCCNIERRQKNRVWIFDDE